MTETYESNPGGAPAAGGGLPPSAVAPPPMAPAPDWLTRLLIPVGESRSWLKFLGVVTFAYGCLTAITIVGLLFAWLPIWMGVLLWQAADRAGRAHLTRDPAQFEEYLKKLRTLIVISGVVTVVSLAATILGLVLAAAFGWMAMLMHSIR